MAFLWGALIVLAGCKTTPDAQSTRSGTIVEVTIPAPSLAGNLLGDPVKQKVSIYLPPGYDSAPEKRYPVLYLLHGFAGTQQTWLKNADTPKVASMANNGYQWAGFLTRDRLDQSFLSGGLTPMIIVSPNGRNAFKHSFYVNSPVTGNWEDYIIEDVLSYVDDNYRTRTDRNSRGIAGHSGGGNGALRMGMRHADKFGSIYAHAPCCIGETFSLPPLQEESGEGTPPFWDTVFRRIGAAASLDDLPAVFTPDMRNFYTNLEVATAAVYAPDPNNPPYFGDPLFSMKNGEPILDPNALARRLALSVYHDIDRHADALRSMRGIYIDYGEYEFEELKQGNREFIYALGERNIPFQSEIYADGDHGNLIVDRMENYGLPFFSKTLRADTD